MFSPLPNYRNVIVWGTGNIFTDRWLPAPKWRSNELLATNTTQGVQPYHVQICLDAERYIKRDELEEILSFSNENIRNKTFEQLVSNSIDGVEFLEGESRNYGSILKVRIRWLDGASRERQIDMDLGAGIDVITPPCHWVQAQLLVPDPNSTRPVPSTFFNTFAFVTQVTASAYCLGYGGNSRLNSVRYTDTVFLSNIPPTVFTTVNVPRKRSTFRVTASSLAIGPLRAIWEPEQPTTSAPAISFPVGMFSALPAGGDQIAINDIPGPTNTWRYTLPGGQETAIVSIVQELIF